MPEVKVSVHGVTVELVDAYGELEDMTARALGLAGQVEQQWRENQVRFYTAQADVATTNEVTT